MVLFDESMFAEHTREGLLADQIDKVIEFTRANPEVAIDPNLAREALVTLGQADADELPIESRARLAAVLVRYDATAIRVTVLRKDLIALLVARGVVPADATFVRQPARCKLNDVEKITVRHIVGILEKGNYQSYARTLAKILADSGEPT